MTTLEDAFARMHALGLYNRGRDEGEPFVELRALHSPEAVEAGLRAVEAKLGRTLPADLREFLARFGDAGFLEYTLGPLPQGAPMGESFMMGTFFSPLDAGVNALTSNIDTYEGRIPDTMLAISRDPGGSLLLYTLDGPDQGKLFFWDHKYRALPPGAFDRMVDELSTAGVDVSHLSMDAIVRTWEERNEAKLGRPIGYGPLYFVADGLIDFVMKLAPMEDDG